MLFSYLFLFLFVCLPSLIDEMAGDEELPGANLAESCSEAQPMYPSPLGQ
jgi:hypothetical protein